LPKIHQINNDMKSSCYFANNAKALVSGRSTPHMVIARGNASRAGTRHGMLQTCSKLRWLC